MSLTAVIFECLSSAYITQCVCLSTCKTQWTENANGCVNVLSFYCDKYLTLVPSCLTVPKILSCRGMKGGHIFPRLSQELKDMVTKNVCVPVLSIEALFVRTGQSPGVFKRAVDLDNSASVLCDLSLSPISSICRGAGQMSKNISQL